MPSEAPLPSGDPGASTRPPEGQEAWGTDLTPPSSPSLTKVIQDISASLQDLREAVREAELQPEPERPPGGRALVASGGHYQELFELAPEAYLVTDDQMVIQEGNRAAAALLNEDRDLLQGRLLRGYIMEEDRAAFQTTLIELREGGEKRNWEIRLQPADGPPFMACINVMTQPDRHDRLVRTLWLLRDAGDCKTGEESLKTLFSRVKSSFIGTVEAFANAVEMKDPQTAGHQRRVAQLAVAIAREMGFSLNRLEGMRIAGLLHDVGKITIPGEILGKPGELSLLECKMIKSHCQAGFELLKDIDFPWPIQQAILQHHERLDGSGYPAGLTDPDIILEARILGVADVVEAMNSSRTYGPAQGIDKALAEIHHEAGVLYDPDVVDICLKLFVEKGFSFH